MTVDNLVCCRIFRCMHGGRFRRVFTAQQLTALKGYVTDMENRGFGLTTLQCRRLVFEYAEANGINHNFGTVSKMAGNGWLASFRETHGISLRAPEATSTSRAMGFNRVEVGKLYNLLEEGISSHAFAASNIYSVDECRHKFIRCCHPVEPNAWRKLFPLNEDAP